jgi:cyclic pyranopterin phosphate synthase
MEALAAASIAALTLYDMLKMLDDTMEITLVKLVNKRGGKSDYRNQVSAPLRAAVLVMSDSVHAGTRKDLSGKLIQERLRDENIVVEEYKVIPDEKLLIVDALGHYADKLGLDLVITTGGTGFGPRDATPEAMTKVIDREIPGVAETLRAHGQARTPHSMFSRGIAGVRGKTVIVNLPGSKRAVAESLDALFPGLFHAFLMLRSGEHPLDSEQIET